MFASVVGHAAAQRALSLARASGRLAHAYLLVGPPQVGKRTLALAVAQALLCPEDEAPCGDCQTCRMVMARKHPDLLLVGHEPMPGGPPTGQAGRQERRGPRASLGLELVHDLQHTLSLAPFEGRCRVAIIDGAERLTNEAANAFLKTLEEPPPASYLFLLSEAEERMLPTILSRCQRLALSPLPAALVEEALVERWGADPATGAAMAGRAKGRLGWAVAALRDPVIIAEAEARLGSLVQLLDQGLTERLEAAADLAQQATDDPEATLDLLADWRRWWEGVLLAKGGLSVTDERQQGVAAKLSWRSLVGVLRSIDNAREHWERNVNPLLAFEHLTLSMPALP